MKRLFLLAALSMTACSTSKPSSSTDPYETFNRHTYNLNKGLDRAIFKPVATVYETVLPDPVLKGLSNFFSNLGDVPTIVNDLLQARFYDALSDTWRLAINSTIGIGGLVDVASKMDLPKHKQDFGLTLAQWGYKQSNYFVIPFFGPSTVRDTIAFPVNQLVFTVYPYVQNVALRNSVYGISLINQRAELLPLDKVIKAAALDPYAFERDAYFQYRRAQIEKNTQSVTPGGVSTQKYVSLN